MPSLSIAPAAACSAQNPTEDDMSTHTPKKTSPDSVSNAAPTVPHDADGDSSRGLTTERARARRSPKDTMPESSHNGLQAINGVSGTSGRTSSSGW
ncbi:hypothetical protein [Corynebacterium hindlerae]|uniref:hypothetical protein n=1 Tax=Corynebacterium hindlerae TaxID=699041 RepID=UPI0031B6DDBE